MQSPQVILVDEKDMPVGTMEKMAAHEKGLLHRAFSVFIFTSDGKMLLQQRAAGKYHSGGLWSNACCSHPLPGEETATAASRRLNEEMGIAVPLKKIFDFIYRAELDKGLIEHEFDHVFVGEYGSTIHFNKTEVSNYRYTNMQDIRHSLQENPEQYTSWFRLSFPRIEAWWSQHYADKPVIPD